VELLLLLLIINCQQIAAKNTVILHPIDTRTDCSRDGHNKTYQGLSVLLPSKFLLLDPSIASTKRGWEKRSFVCRRPISILMNFADYFLSRKMPGLHLRFHTRVSRLFALRATATVHLTSYAAKCYLLAQIVRFLHNARETFRETGTNFRPGW